MLKRSWAALFVLVLLLFPSLTSAAPYLNEVTLTAASTASTIQYFDRDNDGATTTAANRQEVNHWSVANHSTTPVDIRIYTKAAPSYTGGDFGETFGEDYVELRVHPGESKTLPIRLIGYWLEDAPSGGDAALTLLGWNIR